MNAFKLIQSAEDSDFAVNSNSNYDQLIQSIAKSHQTRLYKIPINLSPFEQQYWLEQLESQFHFARFIKENKKSN